MVNVGETLKLVSKLNYEECVVGGDADTEITT